MGVIPETHAKSPGRMCPIHLKGLQESENERGCWGLRGGGCFRIWNRVMSESRSTTEYTYHNTTSQLAGPAVQEKQSTSWTKLLMDARSRFEGLCLGRKYREMHAKSPGRAYPIRLNDLQESGNRRGCWGLRGGGCFKVWNRVVSESRSTAEYTYHNTASQLAGRRQQSRRSRVPLGRSSSWMQGHALRASARGVCTYRIADTM